MTTFTAHSRNEIEHALDRGELWIAMNSGRHWKARRNGKTRTWVKTPTRFEIPIKAGLKLYANVTERDPVAVHGEIGWDKCHFVIGGYAGVGIIES